jgi:spore coat protein CotH
LTVISKSRFQIVLQIVLQIAVGFFAAVGIPSDSFAKPATDSSENQDKLTAERMFAADRVTKIEITIKPKDWDTIRKQTRSFAEALGKELPEKIFTYVKGDVVIDGVRINSVGIRKKGFVGSLNTNRPSLKIKFEEYVDQSPVKGLDRLTLNNNNQDSGRICQYLSYKLFRDSGTHAPRCGFAAVTVNGKYLGIYSNVEPIKRDFLQHSFGDSSGALYEGTVTDFFPKYVTKFESKNKKAKSKYIKAVADVLTADELDDEQLTKLERLVDIEAFTKYWAMESLIGFWDSYCSNQNNYYLYRDSKTEKFYFIPWGADSAFTERSPIPPYFIRPRSVHGKAILPNKLYRNKKIQNEYKSALMSTLEEHWVEKDLLAEVDRLQQLLSRHVSEENDGFKLSLNGYRLFIKSRRESIAEEFADGFPELKAQVSKPVYMKKIGTVAAEFSTTWFDKDPGKASGNEELELSLVINGKKIELDGAYVYAKKDDFDKKNSAVVIMGTSKSTGKQIIVAASLPTTDFLSLEPGPKSGAGVVMQPGTFGMVNAKIKMMFGNLEFEKSSTTQGEEVKGKFKMEVGEFIVGQ